MNFQQSVTLGVEIYDLLSERLGYDIKEFRLWLGVHWTNSEHAKGDVMNRQTSDRGGYGQPHVEVT
jgi:hypothetical protein